MDRKKRALLLVILAFIFFVLGNIFSYFFFIKPRQVENERGFSNPTTTPHINGPSGPPPAL